MAPHDEWTSPSTATTYLSKPSPRRRSSVQSRMDITQHRNYLFVKTVSQKKKQRAVKNGHHPAPQLLICQNRLPEEEAACSQECYQLKMKSSPQTESKYPPPH